MKISLDPIASVQSKALVSKDEETLADGVNYGIADCRKRLRSQRSSLRAQHHPPIDGSNGDVSFAEVLANSMNQSSLSRLVECLLEPVDNMPSREETMKEEEAVIT
jgi:hypothetical protein